MIQGFKDSSKLLKNYKEGKPIGTSGGYGGVKAAEGLDKIIKEQTLEPLNPRPLFHNQLGEEPFIFKRRQNHDGNQAIPVDFGMCRYYGGDILNDERLRRQKAKAG